MKKVLASDKMKQASKDAQPFLKDVHDFVFGREASMENMVRIFYTCFQLYLLTSVLAQRTRSLLQLCCT